MAYENVEKLGNVLMKYVIDDRSQPTQMAEGWSGLMNGLLWACSWRPRGPRGLGAVRQPKDT